MRPEKPKPDDEDCTLAEASGCALILLPFLLFAMGWTAWTFKVGLLIFLGILCLYGVICIWSFFKSK